MGVNKVIYGTTVLVDLSGDTVRADKLAAGYTAHGADGELVTGVLEIVSPKVHLDQGTMYAPATSAYYSVQTVSDTSINFNYYGGSGCEQIVYPITGLVAGCTYTISFSETYNGGFIGDDYYYGCGIMQESEYNATTFPVNAGKPSFVTWYTGSAGTQSSTLTFTAKTTKAYWVWSMARCKDSTVHNITFAVKAQANGISLQDKTVTTNGTVTADSGYDGLGKVTVNVPINEVTLQDKTVTENGTITADAGYDGLGTVTVNVAGSGGDANNEDMLITREYTSYTNPRITKVGDRVFYYHSDLVSVDLPLAASIGVKAFENCSSLRDVNLPSVETVGADAFTYCSKLQTIDFPRLQSFTGNSVTFGNCSKLTALILRNGTMCTINTSTFAYGTPIYNKTTGYIYVPAALVETYKADTNWSYYATRFRALEDYTVDGTTTGALDESKI